MSPLLAIAMLDRHLAANGEDVVLQRYSDDLIDASLLPISVMCRASVRGYQPQEIVGLVQQGDSVVIISPTQINAARWPKPQPENPQATMAGDVRIPRDGFDRLVIAGRPRAVRSCYPKYIGGMLVRLTLHVVG